MNIFSLEIHTFEIRNSHLYGKRDAFKETKKHKVALDDRKHKNNDKLIHIKTTLSCIYFLKVMCHRIVLLKLLFSVLYFRLIILKLNMHSFKYYKNTASIGCNDKAAFYTHAQITECHLYRSMDGIKHHTWICLELE